MYVISHSINAAHPVCKQRDACCDDLGVYLKLGLDMSQVILQA